MVDIPQDQWKSRSFSLGLTLSCTEVNIISEKIFTLCIRLVTESESIISGSRVPDTALRLHRSFGSLSPCGRAPPLDSGRLLKPLRLVPSQPWSKPKGLWLGLLHAFRHIVNVVNDDFLSLSLGDMLTRPESIRDRDRDLFQDRLRDLHGRKLYSTSSEENDCWSIAFRMLLIFS